MLYRVLNRPPIYGCFLRVHGRRVEGGTGTAEPRGQDTPQLRHGSAQHTGVWVGGEMRDLYQ